jgi:uncharacterized protein DUF1259
MHRFVTLMAGVSASAFTLAASAAPIDLKNTVDDDSPHLFFMHFWANDDLSKLTHGLRAALDLANIKHGT